MISNLFNNLPTVTKNFLIINALMLFATAAFENQHINLTQMLGAHNFLSPLFQPYQIVTHFFMHGGIQHLIVNMFGLVLFGSHLERIWGSKKFFWFYIISALGALVLYAGYGTWEMYQLKQQILAETNGNNALVVVDNILRSAAKLNQGVVAFIDNSFNEAVIQGDIYLTQSNMELYSKYIASGFTPMVGASGAIYGILVAFAVLFPNTELMLLIPPIPIKAKYLVGILMIISLYSSFNDDGSSVAHLAHLGGGVIGFILVKLMNRNRRTFY
jgi:membrane associated rhomboid family serine protease